MHSWYDDCKWPRMLRPLRPCCNRLLRGCFARATACSSTSAYCGRPIVVTAMSHVLEHCTSDWEAFGLVAQQLTTLILLWTQLNGVIPLRSLQSEMLIALEDTAVHDVI